MDSLTKLIKTVVFFTLLAALVVPTAAGQLGVGSQTSVSDCRSFTVTSTINIISAGSIVLCNRVPAVVANSAGGFRLGVTLTTPSLTGFLLISNH